MKQRAYGFTIVELLIVIVVIGILAAISVVAYQGISGQAHDSTVRQDLVAIGKRIELFRVETGTIPTFPSPDTLTPLTLQATHASYSEGLTANDGLHYNLLYCRSNSGENYALIAWSKSGDAFVVKNGVLSSFAYDPAIRATSCPRAGITDWGGGWLYDNSVWKI